MRHQPRCRPDRLLQIYPLRRLRINLSLTLSALLLPSLATTTLAQTDEPLVTDRPDFTESAVTVAPGRVQLEAGYSFTREGDVESHTFGELLVRVGLHARVEARVGLNSFRISEIGPVTEEGFEDLAVGAKILIADGASSFDPVRPGIAVLIGAGLPTGAEAFQADGISAEGTLALSWPLSERVAVGSNLNLASEEAGEDRFVQLSGSLAVGVALAQRLGGYVEVFGFSSDDDAGTDAGFVNGGLTYLVNDDFQLDLRVGGSPSDPQPNYFIGAGAAYRVGG